jgi:hypothetical protein
MYKFTSIVKIDSIIRSLCLRHVCRNSLSYSGKETWPTLCKSDTKQRYGVRDLEPNKHQLLHRIQSIRTSLIYNTSQKNRTHRITKKFVNKNFVLTGFQTGIIFVCRMWYFLLLSVIQQITNRNHNPYFSTLIFIYLDEEIRQIVLFLTRIGIFISFFSDFTKDFLNTLSYDNVIFT